MIYFARHYLVEEHCPRHVVGVVEEKRPWRRGKAVMFSRHPYEAIIIGLWFPIPRLVHSVYKHDKWLAPKRWKRRSHPVLDGSRFAGDMERDVSWEAITEKLRRSAPE